MFDYTHKQCSLLSNFKLTECEMHSGEKTANLQGCDDVAATVEGPTDGCLVSLLHESMFCYGITIKIMT